MGREVIILDKVCRICGKTFQVESSKSGTKYCSDECRKKGRREVNLRKNEKRRELYYQKPHPIYERECRRCGKLFTTRRKDKVFCSETCRDSQKYTFRKRYTLSIKEEREFIGDQKDYFYDPVKSYKKQHRLAEEYGFDYGEVQKRKTLEALRRSM